MLYDTGWVLLGVTSGTVAYVAGYVMGHRKGWNSCRSLHNRLNRGDVMTCIVCGHTVEDHDANKCQNCPCARGWVDSYDR